MAIVMLVGMLVPQGAWAQDIEAHLSISGRDADINFIGYLTDVPISSTVYLYQGEQVTVYLDVISGPSVACFPDGDTSIGESGLSELALSDTNEGKFTVTTEGQYTFTLSNGSMGIEEKIYYQDEMDDEGIVIGTIETFREYQVTNANVNLDVVYQSQHTHAYDQKVVKDEALITAPTCTTKGSYYCSCICGELSNDQTFEVPALGHHLVRSDILASAATCTKDAEYKAMCDREGCGFVSETMTYTAYSTALGGHQWADADDGKHHACQREGCEAQEAHSWSHGKCVVCSATDPHFVEVTIVNSSGGFNNEGAENLFDGAPTTKWCSEYDPYTSLEEDQFYVIFQPAKSYVLASYTLVDAGDSERYTNRKWRYWLIAGTNDLDSGSWEFIDEREESYSNKTFTTGCTSAYTYYKLTVYANGCEEPEEGGNERLIQQMADMNIVWCSGHSFDSQTLSATPDEHGLYHYICDECEAECGSECVIKDGVAFHNSAAFTTSNVTMTRTFPTGKPATIMLPFSIEASALATAADGVVTGAKFYGFTSLEYNAATSRWEANMDRVTTTIEAYTPYMIILTEGTAIDIADNKVTFPATPPTLNNTTTTQGNWTFVATNEAKTWTAEDFGNGEAYYGFAAGDASTPEGKFVKVGQGASVDPMRAYIMKNATAGGASNAPARTMEASQMPGTIDVHINEESATGIGTLNTQTGQFTFDGWYDLQGRRISEPAKDGISIHNGKKVKINK